MRDVDDDRRGLSDWRHASVAPKAWSVTRKMAEICSVCSDLLRTVSRHQRGLRDELERVEVDVLVAIDDWR